MTIYGRVSTIFSGTDSRLPEIDTMVFSSYTSKHSKTLGGKSPLDSFPNKAPGLATSNFPCKVAKLL